MPPKRSPESRTWPRDLRPDTQIDFYYRLEEIRGRFLGAALGEVVRRVDIPTLDVELRRSAPRPGVAYLARFGLRGETFFPTPSLLRARPSLLGYYRLLYGISQKDFYKPSAFGGCKQMEVAGELPHVVASDLQGLCRSLGEIGWRLLGGIPTISIETIHELQLLTLGAQFRGSRNTEIGQSATRRVFDLLTAICSPYVTASTDSTFVLINSAKRTIAVKFAHDPDVAIEAATGGRARPIVAIEIKGGTDVSNIHNRIGEAEKSHQKARARGFFQFWTILGAKVDAAMARRESPTTTRFYYLEDLERADSPGAKSFAEDVASQVGIPAP